MGQAGGGCVVYFILVLVFFLTVTAATTKGQGDVAVSSREAQHKFGIPLHLFTDKCVAKDGDQTQHLFIQQ